LHLSGNLAPFAQPKLFASWLRPLFRKHWIVYSKPPFGGPEYVLHYLGRYTHRVAISNHRLVSFDGSQVTFRWRDSAHHNEQKLMMLSLDEFLRRFLLHLLPKGFVRIRNFGFLANRHRAKLLPLCFATLDAVPTPKEPETPTAQPLGALGLCPKCGGPMVVSERLTAAQIQLRSPPLLLPSPHEVAIYIPQPLRASPRYAALRFAARPIASFRILHISKATLLPSPVDFATYSLLLRSKLNTPDLACNPHFPAFNSHRPASAATASGFLLTTVSKANFRGRAQPELSCRSLPIQH
jgi:hypothetical protein